MVPAKVLLLNVKDFAKGRCVKRAWERKMAINVVARATTILVTLRFTTHADIAMIAQRVQVMDNAHRQMACASATKAGHDRV